MVASAPGSLPGRARRSAGHGPPPPRRAGAVTLVNDHSAFRRGAPPAAPGSCLLRQVRSLCDLRQCRHSGPCPPHATTPAPVPESNKRSPARRSTPQRRRSSPGVRTAAGCESPSGGKRVSGRGTAGRPWAAPGRRMEAPGVEPGSRETRKGPLRAYPVVISRAGTPAGRVPLAPARFYAGEARGRGILRWPGFITPYAAPLAGLGSDGLPLARQPARNCECSRLLFCRFLRGQRRLGSQSSPQIAPVDTHRPHMHLRRDSTPARRGRQTPRSPETGDS